MKKRKTERGFNLIEFKDSCNIQCNIQKSSSACEERIWIGAEEIGLKKHFGGQFKDVPTKSKDGVSYIANNRMHLNQKQAKKLIKVLEKFVKTGEI